jgi:hypothetical protein
MGSGRVNGRFKPESVASHVQRIVANEMRGRYEVLCCQQLRATSCRSLVVIGFRVGKKSVHVSQPWGLLAIVTCQQLHEPRRRTRALAVRGIFSGPL